MDMNRLEKFARVFTLVIANNSPFALVQATTEWLFISEKGDAFGLNQIVSVKVTPVDEMDVATARYHAKIHPLCASAPTTSTGLTG